MNYFLGAIIGTLVMAGVMIFGYCFLSFVFWHFLPVNWNLIRLFTGIGFLAGLGFVGISEN